jgi:flagellar hook-associated protein 3 FlgL
MQIRNTQASVFNQVRNGLRLSSLRTARAQEQISSGKRILRPSDDAVGTAIALSIRRQINDVQRMIGSVQAGRQLLEPSTSALERAGTFLSEGRAIVIQGLNGTLSEGDRRILGSQIEQIRQQLVGISNTSSGSTYLFSGTRTGAPPYGSVTQDNEQKLVYQGNEEQHKVTIGFGVELAVNVPGNKIFGKFEPRGAVIAGSSGATVGTTANQGKGFTQLDVRHDSTTATLGSGIALVGGGGQDTFLGDRSITVDATARTVQLGNGAAVNLPPAGDPGLADVTVLDEFGAEIHLDFSGFTDTDFTGTATGAGSVSLDGTNYTPITLTENDLELVDQATGNVLHIDTTAVRRASTDLVTFNGTTDVFDVLQGIQADLENPDISQAELAGRLESRLSELDRHHENVLSGLGSLGARLERLDDSENRLEEVGLHLEGLRSNIEDADISSIALELTKADQTLQLAQATGARLIQNTLLNFLG